MTRVLRIILLSTLFMDAQPTLANPLNSESRFTDIILGDSKAPNTIIEYFSLTCGQCAKFHTNVLPKIKKNFIDTGKAQFIARDFPLNKLAILAHMASRCGPQKFYHPDVNTLFKNFDKWTRKNDPVPALRRFALLGGMSSEKFDACLKDEKLYQGIRKKMTEYSKKFAIDSTPTIIVNGQRVDGSYTSIEKMMD